MVCFINFLDNFLPLFRPELCAIKTMLPYSIIIHKFWTTGQDSRTEKVGSLESNQEGCSTGTLANGP